MTALDFPFKPGPAGTAPTEYARLLAESPTAIARLSDGAPVRLVLTHDDVAAVLSDPRFSRRRAALSPGRGLGRSQGAGIVDFDPPEHGRLRAALDVALGPATVPMDEKRIREIAEELLAGFADEDGPVDLVARYAAPFAGRLTCELLGFPPDDWAGLTGDVESQLLGQPDADVAQRVADRVAHLLELRQREPAQDVASVLAADTRLTGDERATLLHGLIISSHIGIRDILSRHLFALVSHPGLVERLSGQPEELPGTVEELLRRYPSSNDGLARVATQDVELSGTAIAEGELVLPVIAAANQDPEAFPRPEAIDPHRSGAAQLSFGRGPHACPAEALARAEITTALRCLVEQYPNTALAIAPDDVEHNAELLPLGVKALPVRLRG